MRSKTFKIPNKVTTLPKQRKEIFPQWSFDNEFDEVLDSLPCGRFGYDTKANFTKHLDRPDGISFSSKLVPEIHVKRTNGIGYQCYWKNMAISYADMMKITAEAEANLINDNAQHEKNF